MAGRKVDRLSAQRVLKAAGTPGKITLLPDGNGLYLRIGPNGSKSWILRYQKLTKVHDMGLGSFTLISLKEARETAHQQRRLLHIEGADPITTRRAGQMLETTAMTFKKCAEAYISAHRAEWKNARHAGQWPTSLAQHVYPLIGDLPVASVDTPAVITVLTPLWERVPETAIRVRGRLERVLDWAGTSGYRQGDNPARWRGHLENLLSKPKSAAERKREAARRDGHHAALPYPEIADFISGLQARKGVAAKALEFLILTAARTNEVLGATWAEIDLEGRVWTIPGSRMKAGKEHRVPLSDAAVALLDTSQPRPFPLGSMALLNLLQRRMNRHDLTVHGFRSTFSDWCAEQTTFPSEVREMALAHTVGDKVEAAYRRGDLLEKRRQLAEAWARYCEAPAVGDRVVPIRGLVAAGA
jgi:integrase